MSANEQNPHGAANVARFSNLAEKYEKGISSTTRPVAARLIALSPPFTDQSRILDNACGPGVVTEEIQRFIASKGPQNGLKIPVIAADAAPPMIQAFNAKIAQAKDSWPNIGSIKTYAIPAEGLDESVLPTDTITHAYMNFGLFFCTDPVKAASHIYRSLVPGGQAFITSWNDLGYDNAVRKTEGVHNPVNRNFKMPFSDDWRKPEYVKEMLVKAGFDTDKVDVRVEDSLWRRRDAQEMAQIVADVVITILRGRTSWESDAIRDEWTATLAKFLQEEDQVVENGENGFVVRMKANIAICKK